MCVFDATMPFICYQGCPHRHRSPFFAAVAAPRPPGRHGLQQTERASLAHCRHAELSLCVAFGAASCQRRSYRKFTYIQQTYKDTHSTKTRIQQRHAFNKDTHSNRYTKNIHIHVNLGAFDSAHVYSVGDIQRVVAYAHARGIRVIPEFDMPGV